MAIYWLLIEHWVKNLQSKALSERENSLASLTVSGLTGTRVPGFQDSTLVWNVAMLKVSPSLSWSKMVSMASRVCWIFVPDIEPLTSMTKTTFFLLGFKPSGEK